MDFLTNQWSEAANALFLIGLPYAAGTLLVVGLLDRILRRRETITSRSNQFLDVRLHFWSLVPFHYGVMAVLFIHLSCLLIPGLVLSWTAVTWRLYALEIVALSSGLIALVGILLGLSRRRSTRLRRATRWVDWLVMLLLAFQVVSGVLSSILNPWGTAWLAAAGGPYLRSLLWLHPEVALVAGAPFLTKIHLMNAFILIGLLPYTSLVHALMVPVSFVWRPALLYRWKGRSQH